MSILSVLITPERALVGVDTDATRADGGPGRGRISKMVPLIHANTVLAFRGNSPFLGGMFATCNHAGGDFDDMLSQMPTHLADASKGLMQYWARFSLDQDAIMNQEIAFVGWSSHLQRPIGRFFRGDPRGGDFVARDIEQWLVAPPTRDIEAGNLPASETIADIVLLAHAQFARLREEAPACAAGGKFIVACISRDGMNITHACDLGRRAVEQHAQIDSAWS